MIKEALATKGCPLGMLKAPPPPLPMDGNPPPPLEPNENEVIVPGDVVGHLIGVSGAGIKDIREKAGGQEDAKIKEVGDEIGDAAWDNEPWFEPDQIMEMFNLWLDACIAGRDDEVLQYTAKALRFSKEFSHKDLPKVLKKISQALAKPGAPHMETLLLVQFTPMKFTEELFDRLKQIFHAVALTQSQSALSVSFYRLRNRLSWLNNLFQGAYIFCTMLTIAGKDFPKSPQEIAVPTLVMELKDSVEALKPKPKEQELKEMIKQFVDSCTNLLSYMPKPAAGSADPYKDQFAYLKALGTAKDSNSLRPGERCESEERLSDALETLFKAIQRVKKQETDELYRTFPVLMKFVGENRPAALEAVGDKLLELYMPMPLDTSILRKLEEMATPKPFIDVMIDQTPNLAKKFWSKVDVWMKSVKSAKGGPMYESVSYAATHAVEGMPRALEEKDLEDFCRKMKEWAEMFKWLTSDRDKGTRAFASVADGLQALYKEKLLPIEKDFSFHHFFSPELTDADFSARPMVMLVGQYSTGKSTFIRHLLGRDYPGLRIGPEPTTDKFVAVCKGEMDQVIPGNALVVDKSMPFTQLSHFGNNFLTRFECSKLDSPVLNGMSLIDSPGVLSGEKQRIKRGYEFEEVVKWFADRVDMILVLFDVSKLDISDEFRRVLLALKGNDQKIHIVLNKADRVTTPQLMRVYGALMWSLGKVIDTPEEKMIHEELPQLLKLTTEEAASSQAASMSQLTAGASPFAVMKVDGKSERTVYQDQWLQPPNVDEYLKEFEEIGPNSAGKISGSQAKVVLEQSKLPSKVLHAIWNLSDVDKDGALTQAEFALAKHFIKMKLEGQDLPPTLPPQMEIKTGDGYSRSSAEAFVDAYEGRTLEGAYEQINALNTRFKEACVDMESLKQYVDENVSDLKDFIASAILLHFECQAPIRTRYCALQNGKTYTTETLEWSRWLKMGLSAAKLGKSVLTADAIADLPGVVDQVKGLYNMYTKEDGEDFLSFISEAWLEVVFPFTIYEKFQYDNQTANWICANCHAIYLKAGSNRSEAGIEAASSHPEVELPFPSLSLGQEGATAQERAENAMGAALEVKKTTMACCSLFISILPPSTAGADQIVRVVGDNREYARQLILEPLLHEWAGLDGGFGDEETKNEGEKIEELKVQFRRPGPHGAPMGMAPNLGLQGGFPARPKAPQVMMPPSIHSPVPMPRPTMPAPMPPRMQAPPTLPYGPPSGSTFVPRPGRIGGGVSEGVDMNHEPPEIASPLSIEAMQMLLLAALLAQVAQSNKLYFDLADGTKRPTTKVVKLLQGMKDREQQEQLEADSKADEETYDKYKCWCDDNMKNKAILPRDASQTSSCWLSQERVEFLQATSLRLKGEIETAEDEVAKNQAALDTATALRAQQAKER
eukprot:g23872.t1